MLTSSYEIPQRGTCTDCHGSSLMEDHKEGTIVCTECGVVQAVNLLSEDPEWRNFTDDDDNGRSLHEQITERANDDDPEITDRFIGIYTVPGTIRRKKQTEHYSIEQQQQQQQQQRLPRFIDSPIESDEPKGLQSIVDRGDKVLVDAINKIPDTSSCYIDATKILHQFIFNADIQETRLRTNIRVIALASLRIAIYHQKIPVDDDTLLKYADPTMNPRVAINIFEWRLEITRGIISKSKRDMITSQQK